MRITQDRTELVFEKDGMELLLHSYDFQRNCRFAIIRVSQDDETFVVKKQEVAHAFLRLEDMRALHHLIGVAVRRMES